MFRLAVCTRDIFFFFVSFRSMINRSNRGMKKIKAFAGRLDNGRNGTAIDEEDVSRPLIRR